MRKKLSQTLENNSSKVKIDAYKAFDIIGDIAVTKIPNNSLPQAQSIARAIMARHKNVVAVFHQSSGVTGNFRLRGLTHLCGENRTRTIHKESGCVFNVDVESCFFSPRLQNERLRIANLVEPGEIVLNMFAGVGCFSIIIAKKVPSARIYSVDINPEAFKFMEENVHANRDFERIIPILGDSKMVIESRLQRSVDRVLMPLPEKSLEYLPAAVSAVKQVGGWIHCHLFVHVCRGEISTEKAESEVAAKLSCISGKFEIPFSRVVRPTGPNWYQVVVDIRVGSC